MLITIFLLCYSLKWLLNVVYLIFISLTDYFDCPCLLCVHLRVVNLVLLRFFVFRNRTFCLSIYSGAFVSNISCDFWFALLQSGFEQCNALDGLAWTEVEWNGLDWKKWWSSQQGFWGDWEFVFERSKISWNLKNSWKCQPHANHLHFFLHAAIWNVSVRPSVHLSVCLSPCLGFPKVCRLCALFFFHPNESASNFSLWLFVRPSIRLSVWSSIFVSVHLSRRKIMVLWTVEEFYKITKIIKFNTSNLCKEFQSLKPYWLWHFVGGENLRIFILFLK